MSSALTRVYLKTKKQEIPTQKSPSGAVASDFQRLVWESVNGVPDPWNSASPDRLIVPPGPPRLCRLAGGWLSDVMVEGGSLYGYLVLRSPASAPGLVKTADTDVKHKCAAIHNQLELERWIVLEAGWEISLELLQATGKPILSYPGEDLCYLELLQFDVSVEPTPGPTPLPQPVLALPDYVGANVGGKPMKMAR